MNVYFRVDNNIIAFALLGVVLFLAYFTMDKRDRINRKYLGTSLIVLLEIAVETVSCMINGRSESWLVRFSAVLHVCLFTTAPILTYNWYMFIRGWVIPEGAIPCWKSCLLLIPIAVNTVISVLSPFYGFVFNFDAANLYHRGALYPVSAAATYVYMALGLALVLKKRRKIMRQEFIPIVVTCIFPMLGGLLQSLYYGALLTWSSCAYTLVVVYIFLQKRMVHLDGMTGVWTRGSFDYFIARKARLKGDSFGVIVADIDGLKQINDGYGHTEGDRAIKTAVQLLQGALKTDVIARSGGDEFVVVMDCDTCEALDAAVERVKACFARHNALPGAAYRLDCSFGAAMYDKSYNSVEQFLHYVDGMMYASKNVKKALAASSMPEMFETKDISFS